MSYFSRNDIIKPDSGNANQGWQPKDNLSLQEIIKLTKLNDDATYALNSVASPFARRFATTSSFEYCTANFNDASLPFRRIVSDVLDVIELLFNYEVNKNYIEIKKCDLKELKFPGNPSFQNLIAADSESIVYFILYHNRVLAASSYETLFYTNYRIDDWLMEDSSFFGDLKLSDGSIPFDRNNNPRDLKARSEGFQQYMFWLRNNYYECGNMAIGKFIAQQLNYIVKPDSKQFKILLLTSGEQISINKIELHYTTQIQEQNLILDYMLNIDCKINNEKFVLMKNEVNKYEDCLLPINIEELKKFEKPTDHLERITCFSDTVVVEENFSKHAIEEIKVPINMDIGIYPFFKYPDNFFQINQSATKYELSMQSAYNIILAYKEKVNEKNKVDLEFYHLGSSGKLEKIPKHNDNNTMGVIETVRTQKELNDEKFITVHYAIYGTNFELIKITINDKSGLLRPKMENCNLKQDGKIKFAVDFGTTTTYIAYKEGDNDIMPLETFPQSMVLLHRKPAGNKTTASVYEKSDSKELESVIDLIKNEFIPSGIDNSLYHFPIRSVMSVGKSVKEDILLGNSNVAFTYERENETGDNRFETDIKWEGTDNYINSFIAQIIKMCLNKALSLGYNKENVEFLYFTPLSLSRGNKNNIEDEWNKMKDYYKFKCDDMTESLAPYYHLAKGLASGTNRTCVMTIDIGGGSVDSSVFEDTNYKYSSSSKFGCDVLWSNPRATKNDKRNPIYLNYKDSKDSIRIDQSKEFLRKILENMEKSDSQYSSKQIINLWLSNDLCRKIYYDAKWKPVYICHLGAILYNAAQLQKAENGKYPTTLSFSGNGSTYLEKVFNEQEINTIASLIFNKVFMTDNKIQKIILPTDSVPGKQMTAYGGLEASDEEIKRIDENKIYRGTEMLMYEKSCDNDFFMKYWNEVKSSICNNVAEYLKLVIDIINKCRNHNDLEKVDYESLKINDDKRGVWESALEDSLKKKIESSYFFVPVEQIIYDLENEISKNKR